MKRLLTAMVAVALATVLAGQLGAQQQQEPYYDPDWAPQWFKDCKGAKQWVWFPGTYDQIKWAANYLDPEQRTPSVTVSGSFVDVWMDNLKVEQNLKQVWLQFKYTADQALGGIVTEIKYGYPTEYDIKSESPGSILFEPGPGKPGWRNVFENGRGIFSLYWEIQPQPHWERVTIDWNPQIATANVTELYMLTQCNPVPEPVFFQMGALLGLSGLGMLKLRRR